MKTCNKCNIVINTNHQYCPLCHQVLFGQADSQLVELYPDRVSLKRNKYSLINRIDLFIMIIGIIIIAMINVIDFTGDYWSLIPIASVFYLWLFLRIGLFSFSNIALRISMLSVLLIILLLVIDYAYTPVDNGWALNYLLPIILFSSNITVTVITWIRQIYYRDYITYLLFLTVLSIVPFILLVLKVITVSWPTIAVFSYAIFVVLYLLLFLPRWIKDELSKRFHA